MHGLAVQVKEGFPFCSGSLENSGDSYVFDWLYFIECLSSCSSINHLLRLGARYLVLFHLRYKKFSQSTYLPMYLYLEISTSIIRND